MKSWACDLALGLLLATAMPSAAVLAAQSAEQVLLDKASYWRLKDRPDLAIDALQQLLSIDPNQPDALYQFGIIKVQQGKIDEAKGYLVRLQKAAPSSPRIADLENAVRAGQVSPSELSEARRLAQSGQFAQATAKYQQTFKGPPPPTFGVEYYMTLAGTPQGYDEAHKGLQTLVQNSPNDGKAKLALAQVETYRADTRSRGIRSLAQLTDDPVAGNQAQQAWKGALIWLGNSPEDRQFYNQYLAKFPSDAEIRQHVADVEKQGGAIGAGAPGYGDLNRGNLAAAERQFEADLRRDPNDPTALAGLGIVRLRQHRVPQARELLGHAITEYRHILASDPQNQAAQAGLRGALTAERSAATAGIAPRGAGFAGPPANPARARADALRAEGSALDAQGNVAGAGAKYQEAIAVDPNDPWARLDYARLLARQTSLAQAFAVVDPAASGGTAESYQAAAIFYNEQNRVAEALALLDHIPTGSRTADIAALRERIFVTEEIGRAKQLAHSGNRAAARNALISLNSRPPGSPEKTALIANALADIGDTQEALQLARPNPADKKAVLEYAALLQKAGRDAEAAAYLAQAESSGRISAADRRDLEHVKVEIAAKRADQLRTRGDIAGAYDQISALLAAYPNDPTLLLAAGRIYAAAGQNTIAMRFVDAAFRQAPGDLGVIRGAIGGAIMAGDLDRARAYLAQGMQLYPNNPRLYFMEAEIARANGDNGTAVYALQTARSLDNQQAGAFEPAPAAPAVAPGAPSNLPPNPFRQSQADPPGPAFMLAAATQSVAATDATDAPPPTAAPQETPVSADSDDLIAPPHSGDRPPRSIPARPAAVPAVVATTQAQPALQRQLAVLPSAADPDGASGSSEATDQPSPAALPRQLAQLQPLPPPPVPGYQPPPYRQQPASYGPQPAPYGQQQPSFVPQPAPYGQQQPSYVPQPALYGQQPSYFAQQPAAPALQPLPPPPVQGYQPPSFGQAAPVPQDSLGLDIDRSMAAIAAESGPIIQGGLAFRWRDGEPGLSQLTEIGVPIETFFSPFYTGTARLQAIPTFLDAGKPAFTALPRFGHEALLALTPGATIPLPGSQTANGVSLNAAYAYQIFEGEIGSTPLGFPIENLVGRLALMWPAPAVDSTVLPTIPLAPTNVSNPVHVIVEGVRKPITDSLLSYAGTRDPVNGQLWGGVVKTGGDGIVSYDDGFVGAYGGGGGWSIEGKSVASNSEVEGLVGAYVRPYHVGTNAFKIGLNLSYMGYDKNLRFFTFGQGGYFSPQSYVNVSVPMEYSGQNGRYTYLVGGALGVQTFNESSSPFYPLEPARQAALQGTFGNGAVYPSRTVTGIAFNARGQLEYQLDNGFSIGGLASVDNAQNYTEVIGKLYLRKNFGVLPATLPYSLPGSL